jgi:biopolymer transport protein ExbB/TolQ
MRLQILLLSVAVLICAAFALLNWPALNAPAPIRLGVTEIEGPLALVMPGLLLVVIVLFALLALSLQWSLLAESRAHARELRAQRELADSAEASRFTELTRRLEDAVAQLRAQQESGQEALRAEIAQAKADLARVVEETGNSLSAYVGELEDRLEASGVARPRP